jgi:hypothetical protein
MTTATEIITAARRRIGIQAEEEPLSAADGASGLLLLTSMLNLWKIEGSIEDFSVGVLSAAVTVTVYEDTVVTTADFALSANLAVRLAGSLGAPIPPDLIVDADAGKNALVKLQVMAKQEASTFDKGMVYMPSWTLNTVVSDG